MCICCIIANASERFPFVLCSVRDEMYTRPTSDVKVHPLSGTTCCLDELLPEDRRGTWLAINHKLGTFSLLTNSSQQGRVEPQRHEVHSRGLLVLAACETKSGRVSEETLAVPISWTHSSSSPAGVVSSSSSDQLQDDNNDSQHQSPSPTARKNLFSSPQAVAPLAGFNLLSGCLLPGKLDIRLTSNLYGKEFDKCLYSSLTENNAWSMSNTFLDNVHEPRLNFLKTRAKEVVEKFSTDDDNDAATLLATLLGEVMLAQPNFSNDDLPLEHLNLSEENKKNPIEVELERQCQRNISSYCEWLDDGVTTTSASACDNNQQKQQKVLSDKDWEVNETKTAVTIQSRTPQIQETVHHHSHSHSHHDETTTKTSSSTQQQQQEKEKEKEEETQFMMERHSSDKMVRMGITTPHATVKDSKNHCRFDWGTRTHIIVLTEKKKKDDNVVVIHFFVRSISVKVDEFGPRHGPAHQPRYELIPGAWKHLELPYSNN
jgi:hypothetical protein